MINSQRAKPIDYYLNMNYPVLFYRAEEGGYVAEIEELSGCIIEGENLEEIYHRIENARRTWIETAYEDGVDIPLPRTEREYSGRFITRIPSYLHQRLVEQALREGVSLNQHVTTILSIGASGYDMKTNQDMVINEIRKCCKEVTNKIIEEQESIGIVGYYLANWQLGAGMEEAPLQIGESQEFAEEGILAL